jgi:hypothetical protein
LAGRTLAVGEAGKYMHDWFKKKNYQIEEAVYNQYPSSHWVSSTRKGVKNKFQAAMKTMTARITRGEIRVAKAGNVFDAKDFYERPRGMVTYKDDLVFGGEKFFQSDQYYFFRVP